MTSLGQRNADMAMCRRWTPRAVLGVIALVLASVPALESGARTPDLSSRPWNRPYSAYGLHAGSAAAPVFLIENRRVLSYPIDQVWPTAIRYLRIDRGFEIIDRDREAGYLLFEFPLEEKRTGSGSLEMFEAVDASGRPSVSISVNTGAGPVHLPNSILDGIAAKVRAERGQPAPPPPPKQEEPPKGKDKGKGKGKDEPNEDDGSVPLLPPAMDPGQESARENQSFE